MKQALTDHVVWITGGGTGIGRALAFAFADQGATIAVSGRRRDKLDEVVAALKAAGHQARAVPCDVTVEAQVEAAASMVVDLMGGLDVVVANAGYAASGRVEGTDLAVWRRQLEVNVLGAVSTAKHALPELRRTKGRLVLIGSVAAFLPIAGQGPYVVSKRAIAALGDVLATETAGSGVSVTTIHPGFVKSDIAQVDDLGRTVGGRTDRRPAWLLWETEDAARVIVAATVARERERVFTGHGKLAAALGRHLPGAVHTAMTAGAKPTRPPPRDDELGPLARTPIEPIVLTAEPSHPVLFARALWLAQRRPQGVIEGQAFPGVTVRREGVIVPPSTLAAYQASTGHQSTEGRLPLALPEILFLGMMGTIATHDDFPLSPLGLIHVGQTLRAERPLRAGLPLDLTASLDTVTRTPKGLELRIALTATDGDVCWEAVATLLSRAPSVRSGSRGPRRETTAPEGGHAIEVPEDTGRRYAAASGDYNPHHLWAWTARPLGYKRPIAHGMWSLARLLAELPDEVDASAGTVEARFLRPILLPATIRADVAQTDTDWTLRAWDPRTGAPHVEGRYRP